MHTTSLPLTFYVNSGQPYLFMCVLFSDTGQGLYFMHKRNILLSGSSLVISDIGKQPKERSEVGSTLVCVTSNVNNNCCRTTDGGNVGEWWDPTGALVIHENQDISNSIFTRVGYHEQVRLSRRSDATGPVGRYTCAVPDSNGVNTTAYIIITGETRITSITASYLPICDRIWENDRIVRKSIIACTCGNRRSTVKTLMKQKCVLLQDEISDWLQILDGGIFARRKW